MNQLQQLQMMAEDIGFVARLEEVSFVHQGIELDTRLTIAEREDNGYFRGISFWCAYASTGELLLGLWSGRLYRFPVSRSDHDTFFRDMNDGKVWQSGKTPSTISPDLLSKYGIVDISA